jgi:ectoine hydroxylase-related dioxygenase (phytanoyl-CoA dioxygenase family)
MHPHALTPEQKQQYEEQGFLVLRDIVPKDVRDSLQSVFEGVVDRLAKQWFEEGFVDNTFDDLPFETRFAALREQLPPRFASSWRKILVSPEVFALWQRPELLGPIRSLLGDEVYAHGVWNGRPREPHTAIQKILWHQDAHYYKGWDDADGDLISVWMPLVPATELAGCLQVAAGSHKVGYIERLRGFNNLYTVPDDALAGYEIVTCEMNPGDALLFSDLTLHQGLDNHADYVRWSIDIRFGQPSEGIISKTPRGYYCFSASDPSRVETYDAWAPRYNYDEIGLDAEVETEGNTRYNDLDGVAKALNTSRSELEVF